VPFGVKAYGTSAMAFTPYAGSFSSIATDSALP